MAPDGVEAGSHRGPVRFGTGRHQVEHGPQTLDRAGDVVQVRQVGPDFVQFEGELAALGHRRDRDPVDVVDR